MTDSMIGSRKWYKGAEKDWQIGSNRPFDPVRAFRRECLRAFARQRPVEQPIPSSLHDRERLCELGPRFTAYLDQTFAIRDWRQTLRYLRKQPREWWAARLADEQS